MQIGEISKITGFSISTIRYYDKHGLLPYLERENGGIRSFSKRDIDTLNMIHCLKISGMKIAEIKKFMEWCVEGDESINKRLNMILEQEKNINEQINTLNKALKLVKYKEWYYKKAALDKTEKFVKNIPLEQMPKDIAKLYKESHQI